ncbi:MAG: hypothetical protein IJH41_05905 [Eubacterium sp.]|nr:hypothetical protein [Eubacterium sp.]
MSRKPKHKQNPRPEWATSADGKYGYVSVFADMIDSPAFAQLSAPAVKAYICIRRHYAGTGGLATCPYSSFQKNGMRANTVSRAVQELEALGFITIKCGGFPDKSNIYIFSDKWKSLTQEQAIEKQRLFASTWRVTHRKNPHPRW